MHVAPPKSKIYDTQYLFEQLCIECRLKMQTISLNKRLAGRTARWPMRILGALTPAKAWHCVTVLNMTVAEVAQAYRVALRYAREKLKTYTIQHNVPMPAHIIWRGRGRPRKTVPQGQPPPGPTNSGTVGAESDPVIPQAGQTPLTPPVPGSLAEPYPKKMTLPQAHMYKPISDEESARIQQVLDNDIKFGL